MAMSKTLFIDGIKFNLWIPELEEKEFHPIIKELAKEIFGKNTVYLDISTRLKSEAGIGSEPDGFVIDPVNEKLYVVEAELSKHDPYKHIIDQLTRFINCLDNLSTKNSVIGVISEEIEANKELKWYFEEKVKENLYKWLSKLLNKTPNIVVVIEEKTPAVLEACKILKKSCDTRILELQTFRRENAPIVRAYLFDTLYEQEALREDAIKEQTAPKQLVSSMIIDVFMNNKGQSYTAKFDIQKKKIFYEGKDYSPSAVASRIANCSTNGWKAWKFRDGQNKIRPISDLRKS